jgi:hypothetical protein
MIFGFRDNYSTKLEAGPGDPWHRLPWLLNSDGGPDQYLRAFSPFFRSSRTRRKSGDAKMFGVRK